MYRSAESGRKFTPMLQFQVQNSARPPFRVQEVYFYAEPLDEQGTLRHLRLSCSFMLGHTLGLPRRHATKVLFHLQSIPEWPAEVTNFLAIPASPNLSLFNFVNCYWAWDRTLWRQFVGSCRAHGHHLNNGGEPESREQTAKLKFELNARVHNANTYRMFR